MAGGSWKSMAAALLLLADGGPGLAAEPIPAGAKLVPDPAVKIGTLANGMRYAVMQNGAPSGAVSIRLLFRVGSYDEADDELGFAHFIEHLAFRSTRRAPKGVLDNRYAAFGVTLGQDHNAYTTLDATVYRVDLPGNDPAGLRQVLEWLRDASDGIVFSQAAVDVERHVLEAEARARNTVLARVQRESSRFMGRELRVPARDPIGTPESIASAAPRALQAFHRRWYRPERATLIITGAVEPDQVARLAEELFTGWSGIGPAPERLAPPKVLPERAADALVVTEPSLPASVTACRLAPLDIERAPSFERIRRDLLSTLWTRILNARLARLTAAPGSGLLGSLAIATRDGPESRVACLVTVPAEGRWKESLAASQAELRRFASEGPTTAEVAEAIAGVTAEISAAQHEIRQTPALADQIVAAELTGRVIESPAETLATVETVAAGVGPDDINAAFAGDWTGSGPLITATLPTALDRAELLAAWQANEQAAPLAAYVDSEARDWSYDFGRKGRVRKRTVFADPGFVRLEYANGLVVNYKQTDFAPGEVEVRINLGHGLTGLTPETREAMTLGAGMLSLGGLGRLAPEEIENALGLTNWEFDFEPKAQSWLISDRAATEVVPKQMQLLAAFVSDPGFRAGIDEKLPTVIGMAYRMSSTDPAAVADQAFEAAVFPDLRSFPEPEQLLRWRAQDYARVLKPILTTSPLELTVVGDIDEKVLRQIVAKTLGALPNRPPLAPVAGPGPFRRFPEKLPAAAQAVHRGGPEKAGAMLVWPLYVASPERRSEEYALQIVSAVFRNRLIQRARMELGIVYAPTVGTRSPDHADQGYLAASFEAAPADLDRLIGITREIAREIAGGAITDKELVEAREPMLANGRQAIARNASWASALSDSSRSGEGIEEITRFEALAAGVTLDDARRAAATWLTRDPMVSVALPESGKPATAVTVPPVPASKAPVAAER